MRARDVVKWIEADEWILPGMADVQAAVSIRKTGLKLKSLFPVSQATMHRRVSYKAFAESRDYRVR